MITRQGLEESGSVLRTGPRWRAANTALALFVGVSMAWGQQARAADQSVAIGLVNHEGRLVPNMEVALVSGGVHARAQAVGSGVALVKGVQPGKAVLELNATGFPGLVLPLDLPAGAEVGVAVYLTNSGPKIEYVTLEFLHGIAVAETPGLTTAARRYSSRESAARQVTGLSGPVQAASGTPIVADGSFEAGAFGGVWTEASTNFGTPLCDGASCGTGGGTAGPRTGNWWSWFGGVAAPETGSVEQSVTIPFGANTLEFYLWIGASSGNATDFVQARMDGNILFTALENDATYFAGYTLVSLDITTYADGGAHLLRIESTSTGSGTSNFSVDDVAIAEPSGPLPYGACCDDATGECEECILGDECTGTRVLGEMMCSEFDPPCGQGACCDPITGACSIETEDDCTAGGGLYLGGGVACGVDVCPCVVPCPEGSTDENEADCGMPDDTVNGGCNSPVVASNCCVDHAPATGCDDAACEALVCGADSFCCNVEWDGLCAGAAADLCGTLCDDITYPYFSPLTCGETYCGTMELNATLRDTDWYEITVSTETYFTWTVEAEFAVAIGLAETGTPGSGDCDDLVALNPFATAAECEEASISVCVPPGTHWFFVSADVTGPLFACGAGYTATLSCDDCPTGACCMDDGSCDPISGPACDLAGGSYQGDGTSCMPNECPQPVTNDHCDIAEDITVNGATATGNNTLADDDLTDTCGTSAPTNGVWYKVTGTGNTMRASTCHPGTDFDTKMQVFCDCDPMVCVDGNDDADGAPIECDLNGFNRKSIVEWCSAVGQTYYIHVGGFFGAVGNYELSVTDDATACDPAVDCGIPTGACCEDGTCTGTTEETACAGEWFEGEACPGYSCPQPITNDECDTATDIASVPYSTNVDNSGALSSTQTSSCNGSGTAAQNDVWWTYTPSEDCLLDLAVDYSPGISGYDGFTAIYTGPDCDNLTELDCLDSGFGTSDDDATTFNATSGTMYWFQVGDWGSGAGGGPTSFDLDCASAAATGACCFSDGSCTSDGNSADCATNGGDYQGNDVACNPCPQPPANDDCADAETATVPSTINGNTDLATDDNTDPGCLDSSFGPPGKGVWYKVPGTGNTITVSTCNAGTAFLSSNDTQLQVFCDCDPMTCVGGNDDDGACGEGTLLSTFSFCSDASQDYYVLVGGYIGFSGANAGDFELTIADDGTACDPPPDCSGVVSDYCDAGAGTCDEFVSRVEMGSIDNSSSCDDDGVNYSDYTGMSTGVTIGVGESITVTNGNGYSSDQCGVWVDWNQDLDFDDTDETITVSGTAGAGPYTATITPPAGAATGDTRMRIRITYTGAVSACGTTTYGEVEDYTLSVSSARGTTGPWDDDDGDGVPNFCDAPECGNDFVEGMEECDGTDATACPGACLPPSDPNECRCPRCGDGDVNQSAEECDDGTGNSDTTPDACRTDCMLPECGDNVADTGEQCDGSDNSACGGLPCLGNCTCTPPPVCGDNVVNQGSEECDGADDAACPGQCRGDCTCGTGPVGPVPTVSEWGLAILALLLAALGKVYFGRRSARARA